MSNGIRGLIEFLTLYANGFQPVEFVRGEDRITAHASGWRVNGSGHLDSAKDAVAYLDQAPPEQWRQIYCGINLFLVSDRGNVKKHDGTPAETFYLNGRCQIKYQIVKCGKLRNREIYRSHLVAMAFLNYQKGDEREIHHINGYRMDDSVANLVVLSREDHAKVHALGKTAPSGPVDREMPLPKHRVKKDERPVRGKHVGAPACAVPNEPDALDAEGPTERNAHFAEEGEGQAEGKSRRGRGRRRSAGKHRAKDTAQGAFEKERAAEVVTEPLAQAQTSVADESVEVSGHGAFEVPTQASEYSASKLVTAGEQDRVFGRHAQRSGAMDEGAREERVEHETLRHVETVEPTEIAVSASMGESAKPSEATDVPVAVNELTEVSANVAPSEAMESAETIVEANQLDESNAEAAPAHRRTRRGGRRRRRATATDVAQVQESAEPAVEDALKETPAITGPELAAEAPMGERTGTCESEQPAEVTEAAHEVAAEATVETMDETAGKAPVEATSESAVEATSESAVDAKETIPAVEGAAQSQENPPATASDELAAAPLAEASAETAASADTAAKAEDRPYAKATAAAYARAAAAYAAAAEVTVPKRKKSAKQAAAKEVARAEKAAQTEIQPAEKASDQPAGSAPDSAVNPGDDATFNPRSKRRSRKAKAKTEAIASEADASVGNAAADDVDAEDDFPLPTDVEVDDAAFEPEVLAVEDGIEDSTKDDVQQPAERAEARHEVSEEASVPDAPTPAVDAGEPTWDERRATFDRELDRFLGDLAPIPPAGERGKASRARGRQVKAVYRSLRPFHTCEDPVTVFDAALSGLRKGNHAAAEFEGDVPGVLLGLLSQFNQLLKTACEHIAQGDEVERTCAKELLATECATPAYERLGYDAKLRKCARLLDAKERRAVEVPCETAEAEIADEQPVERTESDATSKPSESADAEQSAEAAAEEREDQAIAAAQRAAEDLVEAEGEIPARRRRSRRRRPGKRERARRPRPEAPLSTPSEQAVE